MDWCAAHARAMMRCSARKSMYVWHVIKWSYDVIVTRMPAPTLNLLITRRVVLSVYIYIYICLRIHVYIYIYTHVYTRTKYEVMFCARTQRARSQK